MVFCLNSFWLVIFSWRSVEIELALAVSRSIHDFAQVSSTYDTKGINTWHNFNRLVRVKIWFFKEANLLTRKILVNLPNCSHLSIAALVWIIASYFFKANKRGISNKARLQLNSTNAHMLCITWLYFTSNRSTTKGRTTYFLLKRFSWAL